MNIYLIRHAEAVDRDAQLPDADRALTEKGRMQAAGLGKAMSEQGIVVERLYTSPLVRARETAELLAQHCGAGALAVELCEQLAPDCSAKRLAKFLRKVEAEQVALVGHMPDLGRFTAWLIGGKKAAIDFAKGGVACVSCAAPPDKGEGVLEWMVTPEWFGAATTAVADFSG
jgi:phosphohistidine phosphatase